jgi:methylase of polypeptide subunit release factors
MPVPDQKAARELGRALRRVGFTDGALDDLLGDDAYSSEPGDMVRHAHTLPTTKLGLVVRLLFLGLPVARHDATHALRDSAVAALARLGLAELGVAEVVPLARVTPVQDLFVASDLHSRGDDDPPDYVAGYTPTTRVCDALTPRRRVRRALDVGTGCGALALMAARHADEVVATDVNPRALAFTELSAALNGLDNIETRRGSLFDPVRDERFDLVSCNAPFVVSPETRWTYRDTGLPGDELSAEVVRGAAALLRDDGFATVTISWVSDDPDEPDTRAIRWLEETGCDAWLLSMYGAEPLDHAAEWNDHLAADPVRLDEALARWQAHFDELGIRWVSEGAAVLHRRAGRVSVRIDEVDDDDLEVADKQIRRAFRNRALELRGKKLLRTQLALAPRARVELELRNGRVSAARALLDEGTQPEVELSARLGKAIGSLDGRKRPRFEPGDARVLRELLELGVLRVVEGPGK